MSAPNLKQIEAFVTVADLGSFRGAARHLNTTQPNISARIAALEGLLETRLMDRDAGSVRLTSGGQALLPYARKVLAAVDGMLQATGKASLIQGVLRLGVTELIVHTWLPDFLSGLKKQAPNLVVELTVDVSSTLSEALHDNSLDLTFQNGPFQRRSTGYRELGEHALIWAASPALKIKTDAPLTLHDMTAHPILTHARRTPSYDQLADHIAQGGDTVARLVPSSNLAACLQMTLDGYGIACLPQVMVGQHFKDGTLVRLPYDWAPDPMLFAARYRTERAPAFLKAAVDLAEQLAKAG